MCVRELGAIKRLAGTLPRLAAGICVTMTVDLNAGSVHFSTRGESSKALRERALQYFGRCEVGRILWLAFSVALTHRARLD